MATPIDVEKLKSTQWFTATCERWYGHCEACAALGVEAEPLEAFAAEVLNAPTAIRDWLLAAEPIPESAPVVRFRQYETPLQSEMATGLFYRDYRKGKK